MPDERFEQLLKIMERHGLEMSHMTRGYEKEQVQAYRQAAEEVEERIRGIREVLRDTSVLDRDARNRARWRIAKETGLLEDIEGRIVELGGTSRQRLVDGWETALQMGRKHSAAELSPLAAHVSTAGGGFEPGLVADFAKLDTAAIELGLGTAVADNVTLTSELQAWLRHEVQSGIAAGKNIREISTRVRGILDTGAERSEMITRWATVKGYNLSRQASMETALVHVKSLKKQWLAQNDEKTCPHCLAQHGTVVDVTQDFDPENTYASSPPVPYGGFMLVPPLHPRCRCLIVAWDESYRAYTEFTPQRQHEDARKLAIEQGYWRAMTKGIELPKPPSTSKLDRAFQIILGQSNADARIKYSRVAGEKVWIAISDAVTRNQGGIVQLALNTSAGLRMARYDVKNYGQARRLVQVLLSELEQGFATDVALRSGVVRRKIGVMADATRYSWRPTVRQWRLPRRYRILSRDESEMLDMVDDFLDRWDTRRARRDLAAQLTPMRRSIRSNRSADMLLQNIEYTRDHFGYWNTIKFRRRRARAARRTTRAGRLRTRAIQRGYHSQFGFTSERDPAAANEMVDYILDQISLGTLDAEDARLFGIWASDPFKPRREQALLRLQTRMQAKLTRQPPYPMTSARLGMLDQIDGYNPEYMTDPAEVLVDARQGLWLQREGSRAAGRAEVSAFRLGEQLGFQVPETAVAQNGASLQRMLGEGYMALDPVTGRPPMSRLVSTRRSTNVSLSSRLRSQRSSLYGGFFRLRHGNLDFRSLTPAQRQQVKEFMLWDYMVGNMDVDTTKFVLDERTGLFVHLDFDKAFQEGFLRRRGARQVWNKAAVGTDLDTFASTTHLYSGLMRQARQRRWRTTRFRGVQKSRGFRGVDVTAADFQSILARVEMIDPAIWQSQVSEAMRPLRRSHPLRWWRAKKMTGDPARAYANRMIRSRAALSEFFDAQGLPSSFGGDLGASLRGPASQNQMRVVQQILEGREKATYPMWARRALTDMNTRPAQARIKAQSAKLTRVDDLAEEAVEAISPTALSANQAVFAQQTDAVERISAEFNGQLRAVFTDLPEGVTVDFDYESYTRRIVSAMLDQVQTEAAALELYPNISLRLRRGLEGIFGPDMDPVLRTRLDGVLGSGAFWGEASRADTLRAKAVDAFADEFAEGVRGADVEDIRPTIRSSLLDVLVNGIRFRPGGLTDDVAKRVRATVDDPAVRVRGSGRTRRAAADGVEEVAAPRTPWTVPPETQTVLAGRRRQRNINRFVEAFVKRSSGITDEVWYRDQVRLSILEAIEALDPNNRTSAALFDDVLRRVRARVDDPNVRLPESVRRRTVPEPRRDSFADLQQVFEGDQVVLDFDDPRIDLEAQQALRRFFDGDQMRFDLGLGGGARITRESGEQMRFRFGPDGRAVLDSDAGEQLRFDLGLDTEEFIDEFMRELSEAFSGFDDDLFSFEYSGDLARMVRETVDETMSVVREGTSTADLRAALLSRLRLRLNEYVEFDRSFSDNLADELMEAFDTRFALDQLELIRIDQVERSVLDIVDILTEQRRARMARVFGPDSGVIRSAEDNAALRQVRDIFEAAADRDQLDLDEIIFRSVSDIVDTFENSEGAINLFTTVDEAIRRRIENLIEAYRPDLLTDETLARVGRILDEMFGPLPPTPAALARIEVDKVVGRARRALDDLIDAEILDFDVTIPEVQRLAHDVLEEGLRRQGLSDNVWAVMRARAQLDETLDEVLAGLEPYIVSEVPGLEAVGRAARNSAERATAFRFGASFTKPGLGLRFGLDLSDPGDSALFQRELFSMFGRRFIFKLDLGPAAEGAVKAIKYVARGELGDQARRLEAMTSDFARRLGFGVPDYGEVRKRLQGVLDGPDSVYTVLLRKVEEKFQPFLQMLDDSPEAISFSDLDHSDIVQLQEMLLFNWLMGNQNRHINSVLKDVTTGDLIPNDMRAVRLGKAGSPVSIREYAEGSAEQEQLIALRQTLYSEFRPLVEGARGERRRRDLAILLKKLAEDSPEGKDSLTALADAVAERGPRTLQGTTVERFGRRAGSRAPRAGEDFTFELSPEDLQEGYFSRILEVDDWGFVDGDSAVFADGSELRIVLRYSEALDSNMMSWDLASGSQNSMAARTADILRELGEDRQSWARLVSHIRRRGNVGDVTSFYATRKIPEWFEAPGGQIDPPDVWKQFVAAIDNGTIEVSFEDIQPFLTRLEGEDGVALAKEYSRIIYGADSIGDVVFRDVEARADQLYETFMFADGSILQRRPTTLFATSVERQRVVAWTVITPRGVRDSTAERLAAQFGEDIPPNWRQEVSAQNPVRSGNAISLDQSLDNLLQENPVDGTKSYIPFDDAAAFANKFVNLRKSVEEFYESLGVAVRKPRYERQINDQERLAREFADALGMGVPPVHSQSALSRDLAGAVVTDPLSVQALSRSRVQVRLRGVPDFEDWSPGDRLIVGTSVVERRADSFVIETSGVEQAVEVSEIIDRLGRVSDIEDIRFFRASEPEDWGLVNGDFVLFGDDSVLLFRSQADDPWLVQAGFLDSQAASVKRAISEGEVEATLEGLREHTEGARFLRRGAAEEGGVIQEVAEQVPEEALRTAPSTDDLTEEFLDFEREFLAFAREFIEENYPVDEDRVNILVEVARAELRALIQGEDVLAPNWYDDILIRMEWAAQELDVLTEGYIDRLNIWSTGLRVRFLEEDLVVPARRYEWVEEYEWVEDEISEGFIQAEARGLTEEQFEAAGLLQEIPVTRGDYLEFEDGSRLIWGDGRWVIQGDPEEMAARAVAEHMVENTPLAGNVARMVEDRWGRIRLFRRRNNDFYGGPEPPTSTIRQAPLVVGEAPRWRPGERLVGSDGSYLQFTQTGRWVRREVNAEPIYVSQADAEDFIQDVMDTGTRDFSFYTTRSDAQDWGLAEGDFIYFSDDSTLTFWPGQLAGTDWVLSSASDWEGMAGRVLRAMRANEIPRFDPSEIRAFAFDLDESALFLRHQVDDRWLFSGRPTVGGPDTQRVVASEAGRDDSILVWNLEVDDIDLEPGMRWDFYDGSSLEFTTDEVWIYTSGGYSDEVSDAWIESEFFLSELEGMRFSRLEEVYDLVDSDFDVSGSILVFGDGSTLRLRRSDPRTWELDERFSVSSDAARVHDDLLDALEDPDMYFLEDDIAAMFDYMESGYRYEIRHMRRVDEDSSRHFVQRLRDEEDIDLWEQGVDVVRSEEAGVLSVEALETTGRSPAVEAVGTALVPDYIRQGDWKPGDYLLLPIPAQDVATLGWPAGDNILLYAGDGNWSYFDRVRGLWTHDIPLDDERARGGIRGIFLDGVVDGRQVGIPIEERFLAGARFYSRGFGQEIADGTEFARYLNNIGDEVDLFPPGFLEFHNTNVRAIWHRDSASWRLIQGGDSEVAALFETQDWDNVFQALGPATVYRSIQTRIPVVVDDELDFVLRNLIEDGDGGVVSLENGAQVRISPGGKVSIRFELAPDEPFQTEMFLGDKSSDDFRKLLGITRSEIEERTMTGYSRYVEVSPEEWDRSGVIFFSDDSFFAYSGREGDVWRYGGPFNAEMSEQFYRNVGDVTSFSEVRAMAEEVSGARFFRLVSGDRPDRPRDVRPRDVRPSGAGVPDEAPSGVRPGDEELWTPDVRRAEDVPDEVPRLVDDVEPVERGDYFQAVHSLDRGLEPEDVLWTEFDHAVEQAEDILVNPYIYVDEEEVLPDAENFGLNQWIVEYRRRDLDQEVEINISAGDDLPDRWLWDEGDRLELADGTVLEVVLVPDPHYGMRVPGLGWDVVSAADDFDPAFLERAGDDLWDTAGLRTHGVVRVRRTERFDSDLTDDIEWTDRPGIEVGYRGGEDELEPVAAYRLDWFYCSDSRRVCRGHATAEAAREHMEQLNAASPDESVAWAVVEGTDVDIFDPNMTLTGVFEVDRLLLEQPYSGIMVFRDGQFVPIWSDVARLVDDAAPRRPRPPAAFDPPTSVDMARGPAPTRPDWDVGDRVVFRTPPPPLADSLPIDDGDVLMFDEDGFRLLRVGVSVEPVWFDLEDGDELLLDLLDLIEAGDINVDYNFMRREIIEEGREALEEAWGLGNAGDRILVRSGDQAAFDLEYDENSWKVVRTHIELDDDFDPDAFEFMDSEDFLEYLNTNNFDITIQRGVQATPDMARFRPVTASVDEGEDVLVRARRVLEETGQIRDLDEAAEMLPTSWTEDLTLGDEGFRALGDFREARPYQEWAEEDLSAALEFGIWQYLTSTRFLSSESVLYRRGELIPPVGVNSFVYLNPAESFADFMENVWSFRGLDTYFSRGEVSFNFDGVTAILDRIDQLDVEEWQRKIRETLERLARAEGRDYLTQMELDFIAVQPERLRKLRDDVTETFESWIEERNRVMEVRARAFGNEFEEFEWRPAWRAADPDPDVPDAAAGDVLDDVEAMISARSVQSRRADPEWEDLKARLEQCRIVE